MKIAWASVCFAIAILALSAASAVEPPVKPAEPPAIPPDEPQAEAFSLARAAEYMDTATLDWQNSHACTACHTMFPYLMARPALTAIAPQSAEVRSFFEEIAAGKRDPMPSYECNDVEGAVAVGVAVSLALNDRGTTGKLHPLTKAALDRMWTFQRADGGWQWPFRDTPPLKFSEHYGATLAAVGVGMAPEAYAGTPAAVAGLAGIRRYLRNTPPVSLHQRAMLLWASDYVDDVLAESDRQTTLAALFGAQRPDGGWSMASMVDNTQDPAIAGSERVRSARNEAGYGRDFLAYVGRELNYKSSLASDGYATGFAIYVARQSGVAATDARLARGIAWLKANQRASGRWFTPSQSWHTQNMIANAGTAYAVLALEACGEVPAAAGR